MGRWAVFLWELFDDQERSDDILTDPVWSVPWMLWRRLPRLPTFLPRRSSATTAWSGVPLTAIAALVEPTEDARYLRFDSFDQDYFNGWDLTSTMHPQTILAYAYNDRPLMPDHGAPVRLYSPIKLGYKLTKYLTAVTFTRSQPGGYWEDQGYPWLGGV